MLNYRRILIAVYDVCTIPVAWLLAFWVRANFDEMHASLLHEFLHDLPVLVLIQAASFWVFGLYRGQWRFASILDLLRILKAVLTGTVLSLLFLYFTATSSHGLLYVPPRSIFPLYSIFIIFLLGGARFSVRAVREMRMHHGFEQDVLIVGAGQAGESLIRELLRDSQKRYYPSVMVDDNPAKKGNEILGVRVEGTTADIADIVQKYDLKHVLVAMPSADSQAMQSIVDICTGLNLQCRTLPAISDLASGAITINDLREVSLEDLLGRDAINIYDEQLQHEFNAKRILVTGGGGSIGSELCRQLSSLGPKHIIIVDHSEYNLYAIELELRDKFPNSMITACLQDIVNESAVESLLSEFKPDVIFHAAAYKHVPLLEKQAFVAIRNNILGTMVVAQAAVKHNVGKFVLVSTDKAVNPTNIMGTTKRVAEIFCQNLNGQSNTKFITIRFGNVLGSAGSVVPLFKQQLQQGGPITVTHPDITRFFMTIPEACQLILHSELMGRGGEIFVLDMGKPIKITYLAEQMIILSGKVPGQDIEIKFTGLRPGEKLYEELFHEGEKLVDTKHKKISKSLSRQHDFSDVSASLERLLDCCNQSKLSSAVNELLLLVPEAKLESNRSNNLD